MTDLAAWLAAFETVSIAFFLVVGAFQLVLMITAGLELRHLRRHLVPGLDRWVLRSPTTPTISCLVPAYNEAASITETVWAMLALDYPRLQIVVINDGSSDDTMQLLIESFDLRPTLGIDPTPLTYKPVVELYRSETTPRLLVIDKTNGGKSDALNAGLGYAEGRLVCAVDADTILEPDALSKLSSAFHDNPNILAAGGSVRPINGCAVSQGRVIDRKLPTSFLGTVQAIEYSRAFLFGRLGWNRVGGNILISGAFGLFSRRAVVDAGGYMTSTVGEDLELILRLRRRAMDMNQSDHVWFGPEPMAWTEVPESVRTLARQRNRWHRGLVDVLWCHRGMFGRPRYGIVGTVVLPFYLLEAIAPIVELLGMVVGIVGLATGLMKPSLFSSFILAAYGFGFLLSSISGAYESRLDMGQTSETRLARRVLIQILEQFGYRQLTVVWRLWGIVSWLRGSKEWGEQTRKGLQANLVAKT